MSVLTKTPCRQGRIQVLGGLKLLQFLGLSLEREYKITTAKLGTKVNIYLHPPLPPPLSAL
jgi:hypothetical protein